MNTLKWLLPRLPLPMLALAASYGVYQFALLFVPHWVAIVQASAFEVTYIGLAIMEAGRAEQRKRATAISVGAVVVSVLYNSLAGFFHRNGLGSLSLAGEIALAALHGAPLAIVAYLVADLLLHNEALDVETEETILQPAFPVAMEAQEEAPIVQIEPANAQPLLPSLTAGLQVDASGLQEEASDFWGDVEEVQVPASSVQKPDGVSSDAWEAWNLLQSGMTKSEIAKQRGVNPSTVGRWIQSVETKAGQVVA